MCSEHQAQGYTDTHAHLWTDDYLDALQNLGAGESVQVARGIGAGDRPEELAARLAMMDQAGVRCQILSAPQSPQWGTAGEALQLARQINDRYAQLITQYPTRFRAYGAVPLPHLPEAIAETRRCVLELGFDGIAINTLIRGHLSPADARFIPFFETLNDLGATLYLHPTGCGANSPMVNDFRLEWVIGAPIEDMLICLQLLKADLPRRFPNINFHIAHLGGMLAFMMQRIEDNYTDWQAFSSSPWEALRRFWFDTTNFHAPALRCMIDTFGHERLLLGSDFPYFQHEQYTRAVRYIQQADLPPHVQKAILQDNAEHLRPKTQQSL